MKNYRIPDSVYKLVVAEFADYDRKRRFLATVGERRAANDLVKVYVDHVVAIDAALMSTCRGEDQAAREALRYDIAEGRGFNTSAAKKFYTSRELFIRRKSAAIYEVARSLEFI